MLEFLVARRVGLGLFFRLRIRELPNWDFVILVCAGKCDYVDMPDIRFKMNFYDLSVLKIFFGNVPKQNRMAD